MTDREAFIAAILARPADKNLRLIYADWLEDHGEPGEADAMRNPPKWRPSNGTSGSIWEEECAEHCAKYRNGKCSILNRMFWHQEDEPQYPEQLITLFGRDICTAFVDAATYIPPARTRKPAKGQMSLFVLEESK